MDFKGRTIMSRINDFEYLDWSSPEQIYVSQEEWDAIQELLDRDPEISEKLRDLFKKSGYIEEDTNNS